MTLRSHAASPLALTLALYTFVAPAIATEAPPSGAVFRQVEIADVVAAVQPAVVKIDVAKTVEGIARLGGQAGDLQEFLQRFGPFGPPAGARPPARATGVGSGFVIDGQGHIVTNNHVIDGAETITVTLHDGKQHTAELVGSDPLTDLAVLRIETDEQLPSIAFGDSDSARVGDWVVAIGNPFGFGGSVTAGIISARGRDIRSGPYDDYLQIDAPINSGNSGGPVVDATGKVIGVNTAIFSPNGGNIGIGFAIPAAEAMRVVAQLKDSGSVTRGWIGVQIQDITPDVAKALALDDVQGALVAQVVPDSPAAAAGLQPGDVVLRYGDTAIAAPRDLSRAVARTAPETHVKVEILRNGKIRELDTEITRQVPAKMAAAPAAKGGESVASLSEFGLALAPLSPEARARLALEPDTQGVVVVGVRNGGTADTSGIRPGDLLVTVDRQAVHDAAGAERALDAARRAERPAIVLVRRGPEQFFTTLAVS